MDGITIDYGLDPTGYMAGVGQVISGNTSMQQSMAGVTVGSTMLQRALSVATPTRAAAAGLAALGAAAAQTQAQMHHLEATSSVTGVSVDKLAGGIRKLARDVPLGNDGANALVSQYTKMGIASAGSEAKIAKLSKTAANLGGATGEAPAVLADGLTNLARVTGNTTLDTKRYSDLADSLTTVSLKSGASASGILALSKNIAPMAGAAGIGATGVLGISSAFARLGEDGIGASTTVNKMLGDMNKAVRDGGPEIMAYANIVGKTSDEFSKLFKSNPTEAITQVTEALANAGSAGPRQMDLIGLDGVRAQRQLQGLVVSGGMKPGIAAAMEGYGSGSTAKAAEAAYGGLTDSLTTLTSASAQLASAFGTPLLGPMTAFTKLLGNGTGKLVDLVSNSGAQKAIGLVGGAVGAALLAKSAVGAAGVLGLGRQAATSGTVRALAAGVAAGRGDTTSRVSRFGGRAGELANSQVAYFGTGGQLGHVLDKDGNTVMTKDASGNLVPKMRPLGNFERSTYARGLGVGQGLGPVGPPGPSIASRVMGTVRAYGGNLVTTYADSARANLWNQSGQRGKDPFKREDSWKPSAGFTDAWAAAKAAPGPSLGGDGIKAFHASLTGLNASTIKTSAIITTLGKSAYQAAMMTQSLSRSGVGMALGGAKAAAGAGVRRVGQLAGSAVGMLGGGTGIALMAGMGAYKLRGDAIEDRANQAKDFAATDINKTINTYREQAGQATKAVVTVASTGAAYAQSVASLTKTMDQARTVTDETMAAGKNTSSKIVHTYSGTPAQQAAQIAGLSVNGLTAGDIANASVDLARNGANSKADVQAIINAIPKSAELDESLPRTATGSGVANLRAQIAPVINTGAGQHEYEGGGWRGWAGRLEGSGTGQDNMATLESNATAPGWYKSILFGVGGGMHKSLLKEEDTKTLESAVLTSDQRKNTQGMTFTPGYAKQEQLAGFEAMLGDVAKSGDAESYLQLGKFITGSLTGDKQYDLTPKMLTENGGLAGALAALDPKYAATKKTDDAERAKQPGGIYTPDEQQSIDSKTLTTLAPQVSGFFDYRGAKEGSPQAASMASSMLPENVSLLDAAVKKMVGTTNGSAAALSELKSQAAAAASGLTPGAPAFLQAVALQARTGREQAYAEQEQMPSQVMATRAGEFVKMKNNTENTELGQQARDAGEQGLNDLRGEYMSQMTARVQAQRSADVAKGIAGEDYSTAKGYAVQDYNKQAWRAQRDFDRQQLRAGEDHNKQVARSEQDYGISRGRQIRDFNLQIQYTEADAAKTRFRTVRDYNIGAAQSEKDFQISKYRTIRDFGIQSAHAEQDFQIARGRALRDHNISIKRQVEDAAATMYDPYTRIATKPTWDTPNMLVNLEQQTAAMVKQAKQLDQIRKAGVSEQTINTLGLGKAENAQQLNNTAADITSSPDLVKSLNAAADARTKAVAKLVTDPSNVALTRATEDLNKSLSDQEADLAKSLARSLEAMNRGLADQGADLSKNMLRTREAMKRGLSDQAQDLATSLARSRKGLNVALVDQAGDFKRNMTRGNTDYNLALKRNGADLKTALADMAYQHNTSLTRQETAYKLSMARIDRALLEADKKVGQDFNKLSETYNKAIHGTGIKWAGIMKTDSEKMIGVVEDVLLPGLVKAWAKVGLPLPKAPAKQTSVIPGITFSADGGTIPGFSPHPKADNVPVMATAGEFMQPVSAVDYYGVGAMEAIRTRRVPKDKLQGLYDGGLVNFGHDLQKKGFRVGEHPLFGGVSPTAHTPGSWHYKGGAIDVNHDQGSEKAALDGVISAARAHNLRVLWQIAGHFDHAHFDISTGPDMIGEDVPAGKRSNTGSFADTGGGGGLSDKVIDAILAKAPKGGMFYTHLLNTIGTQMKAQFGDAGAGQTFTGGGNPSANAKLGQQIAAARGWTGNQWGALNRLWIKESGWNHLISNGGGNHPDNGRAFGIPQSLPGNKMATAGADWRTNPATQIKWGLDYIAGRYGSPVNAMAHSSAVGWYDQGGVVPPGLSVVKNDTGQPEALLSPDQWNMIKALVTRDDGQTLAASTGTHMTVIHNETITYDSRNDFGGAKITVVASDPDDMANQLSRRAVAGRLTQTRGVAWSPRR